MKPRGQSPGYPAKPDEFDRGGNRPNGSFQEENAAKYSYTNSLRSRRDNFERTEAV
jgi:hypothetical protein